MRYARILGAILAISLLMVGYLPAESDKTNTIPQKICPVMTFGDLGCSVTKKDVYTDYQGKRIFFCSETCREIFQKDPEKYMKKMKAQGVVIMDTPVEDH